MAAKKRGRKKRTIDDGFGAVPRYHQVYLVLSQRLREGFYLPERPLPTEQDLMQEFGLSRVTIRHALAEIEREGLIRRVRGSGTFPIITSAKDSSRANISGLYENLTTLGQTTKARLLRFERVTTPSTLRTREPMFGSMALLIVRVRHMGREPFSYLLSYLPEASARHFRKDRLGNQPLLMTLELAGITPAMAEQSLSAKAADAEVAKALKVPVGSPLIHMKRLTRDRQGAPIEYFESYYRPDRFEYQMTLSRVLSGGAPKWTPTT
jgi:GntR family transcriptional regulator